jgi:hypothetical protein
MLRKSRSVEDKLISRGSYTHRLDPSDLTTEEAETIKAQLSLPWLKNDPGHSQRSIEDRVVDRFMHNYVLYPCAETSSPGFLEHLPSLFKEVNLDGRYALRWAVRAAAFADASRETEGDALTRKALECYGMALESLGQSLAQPGKPPDDYDLMTVVVLDIFEV